MESVLGALFLFDEKHHYRSGTPMHEGLAEHEKPHLFLLIVVCVAIALLARRLRTRGLSGP